MFRLYGFEWVWKCVWTVSLKVTLWKWPWPILRNLSTLNNSQYASRFIQQVYRLCDAEKLNLSSDVGDSGSKKYKRDYDDAYGGV
jgi:hypothetical protein